MKNNNTTRIGIFIALLLIVIGVHLIVIKIIIPKEESATQEKAAEQTVQPETPAPAPVPTPTAAASPAAAQPTAPASAAASAPAPAPAAKTRLFRAPAGLEIGKPYLYKSRVSRLPASVPYAGSVRTGIIVDLNSHRVLWEKDSEKSVPVASMVKMMTTLLTLEAIDRTPDLSLDTRVQIPRLKYPTSGVAWLDPRESFSIEELLRIMLVKSANDAAIVIAHRMGNGSIPAFVARMNARAAALGMNRTKFNSPCGLPDNRRKNSLSSARDMTVLGEQLLNYPVVQEWCLLKETSIRNGRTKFVNTNHLIVPHYPGVDGLKTGYTRDSGFCLTFTAKRNGRRLIGCVTGCKSGNERDVFCRRLLDWGFRRAEELEHPGSESAAQTPSPKSDKNSAAKRRQNSKKSKSKRR